MFSSIPKAWEGCLNHNNNVKELVRRSEIASLILLDPRIFLSTRFSAEYQSDRFW